MFALTVHEALFLQIDSVYVLRFISYACFCAVRCVTFDKFILNSCLYNCLTVVCCIRAYSYSHF